MSRYGANKRNNTYKNRRRDTYDELNSRIQKSTKRYVQFSKKMMTFFIILLLAIVIFAMVMSVVLLSEGIVNSLITCIAVTVLGAAIWYFKNSEAEKKSRITAEVERMKLEYRKSGEIIDEPFDKVLAELNKPVEDEITGVDDVSFDDLNLTYHDYYSDDNSVG